MFGHFDVVSKRLACEAWQSYALQIYIVRVQ